MRRLPKEEVTIRQEGPDHVIVGAHEHLGYVFHTRVRISDIPNEFVSFDDLKLHMSQTGVYVAEGG